MQLGTAGGSWGLPETAGDCQRQPGTAGGSWALPEAAGHCRRQLGTAGGSWALRVPATGYSLHLDTTLATLRTLDPVRQDPRAVPTRQTSSSGRPKSPRIQVVLPEELCERLADLADLEARTVSNMARVLIQQGIERLERQLEGELIEAPDPPAAAPASRRPAAPPAIRPDRLRSSRLNPAGQAPDPLRPERIRPQGLQIGRAHV